MLPYLLGATGLFGLFLLTLSPPGRALRRRLMARAYDGVQRRFEEHVAARKRALFAGLEGTVLELGPGTGANFVHFPASVESWIGIEPNPYMHPPLRAAAAARGIPAEFRTVTTEAMDVPDASVDAVVSTLVLCSVPDPARALADVQRVLRPGGRFVFLEHVVASPGTRLRAMQRLLRPVWRYLADGCCPDRDLAGAIRTAGFEEIELEAFTVPRGASSAIVSPHIAGSARTAPVASAPG